MRSENTPEGRKAIDADEAVSLLLAMCRNKRAHAVFPPGGTGVEQRVTVEMLKVHGDRLEEVAELVRVQAEQIRLLKEMAGVAA